MPAAVVDFNRSRTNLSPGWGQGQQARCTARCAARSRPAPDTCARRVRAGTSPAEDAAALANPRRWEPLPPGFSQRVRATRSACVHSRAHLRRLTRRDAAPVPLLLRGPLRNTTSLRSVGDRLREYYGHADPTHTRHGREG